MKVYMMRHGITGWNQKHKLQGQVNIPLAKEGIDIAKQSAENMKDIPFDIVYSSPLKRAYTTAQIVRGDREIPIIRDDRLKEMSFGIWEGCRLDKFMNDPKYKRMQRFHTDPEHYRAPKYGETFREVAKRGKDFFYDKLVPLEGQYDNILVTAHGAIIRGTIIAISGRPMSQFWETPFGLNCSVCIFDVTDGKATIDTENKIYYKADNDVWVRSWDIHPHR